MVAASLDSKAALNLSRVNWGRESKPGGGMGTAFSGRVVPSMRRGFAFRIGVAACSGSILLGKLSAGDGAFATSLSGYRNDSGVFFSEIFAHIGEVFRIRVFNHTRVKSMKHAPIFFWPYSNISGYFLGT